MSVKKMNLFWYIEEKVKKSNSYLVDFMIEYIDILKLRINRMYECCLLINFYFCFY